MPIDFIAQEAPSLWSLVTALPIIAVLISACVDPEMVEVYLGDSHLLVATMALVVLVAIVRL
jgi:hypothetical protein